MLNAPSDYLATVLRFLQPVCISAALASGQAGALKERLGALQLMLELNHARQEVHAALILGGCHRDAPAFAHFSDDVFRRHHHVLEEDLVVVGFAGQLPDRRDPYSGRTHVDEHKAEPAVPHAVGLGAHQGKAPARQMRLCCPDLVAVHQPPASRWRAARAHRSQVGA
ncbi:hypothetical protein D9M72_382270 [compost metagenome]